MMYESETFEAILQRMLDMVPGAVDKREGSIIYNALSPAALELAQMYIELDTTYNLTFADTSTGEYLSRRTAEFGVNREEATKAIRLGIFKNEVGDYIDIVIGSRFSLENLNYTAIEKISTGQYKLECEALGILGNQDFGQLIPIQNIAGLATAELTDVLVPGEDEETDENLRARFYEVVNNPTFGGNISQYKQTINFIDGVGGTKVFPTWQGGGTVKCTIIASDFSTPSTQLISDVQEAVDPTQNQGKGYGTAPIGHQVTIAGVQSVAVNVVATLTLEAGYSVPQVQSDIEAAIDNYLLGLRKSWADNSGLIVRTAFIDSGILGVLGVTDISGTSLNGVQANLEMGEENIPVLGTVTLNV